MKTDRLVSIIFVLLDKKRIDAQALAEMFEVSPRTIYRDIDAINITVFRFALPPAWAAALKLCRNINLIKIFFQLQTSLPSSRGLPICLISYAEMNCQIHWQR